MGGFTVKTFGILTQKLDKQELKLPFCEDTEQLKQQIFQRYPALLNFNFSLAVDKKLVQEPQPLTGNEEIALLPPFSGG